MSNTRKLKAEAKLEDLSFDFEDDEYTAPHPKYWPLDAIEAQEDGKITAFLKSVLGDEQYKKFKRKPRTLTDLENMLAALMDSVDMEKLDGSTE